MANFFTKIGKAIGKIFDPSSWFKMPTIQLPSLEQVTQPTAVPVTQPKAPIVEPAEMAGVSRKKTGLSLFSNNLTPTLQSLIGLATTSMPAGMLIPGGGTK